MQWGAGKERMTSVRDTAWFETKLTVQRLKTLGAWTTEHFQSQTHL